MKQKIYVYVSDDVLDLIKNSKLNLAILLEEAVVNVLNMPLYKILNCEEFKILLAEELIVWVDEYYSDMWDTIPSSFKPYLFCVLNSELYKLCSETLKRIKEVKHEDNISNR